MKSQFINSISRRKFVKESTLAAGGVMLATLPIGAVAHVAGNETLKLALVGCGGRGTGAANQAFRADPDTQLVAVADAFADQAAKCLENLGKNNEDRIKVTEESTFVGFDAYKKAIDMADVVILATTPGFRPVHFRYAIEQGKHVFMEKPVATDAPGIRSVLETAKLAKEKNLNVVWNL